MKTDQIRVVVYGNQNEDWINALRPEANVWKNIIAVKEVVMIPTNTLLQNSLPDSSLRTVIIPLMELDILNCSNSYNALIPDLNSLTILSNKAAFLKYAEINKLSHLCPVIYKKPEEVVFPCVLKRIDQQAGQGIVVVHSHKELQESLLKESWLNHPCILQAYQERSAEYALHCVCQNGKIIWNTCFGYQLDIPFPIRGINYNVINTPNIVLSQTQMTQLESLLLPLNFTGPCNFDFCINKKNDVIVFEINPRLGGSLFAPRNIEFLTAALTQIIILALDQGKF